jgi:c-di-GMP-binding flagellar brake protein YcgR
MTDKDSKFVERRRTPRVTMERELVLFPGGEGQAGVGQEDDAIVAHSVDVNLGGIYCRINRYLPLFTKMGVVIHLPLLKSEEQSESPVEVEAVLVRVEPEEAIEDCTEYFCALAFLDLPENSELTLARYILQNIMQSQ